MPDYKPRTLDEAHGCGRSLGRIVGARLRQDVDEAIGLGNLDRARDRIKKALVSIEALSDYKIGRWTRVIRFYPAATEFGTPIVEIKRHRQDIYDALIDGYRKALREEALNPGWYRERDDETVRRLWNELVAEHPRASDLRHPSLTRGR